MPRDKPITLRFLLYFYAIFMHFQKSVLVQKKIIQSILQNSILESLDLSECFFLNSERIYEVSELAHTAII